MDTSNQILTMNRLISLLILSLLTSGCGLIPAKETPPPAWATNPPANTAEVLYGAAMKPSRDSAVKAALAQIASNISVDISASTATSTQMRNGSENFQMDEEVLSKVNKTQFTDYRVVDTAPVKYGVWVLVEVNKRNMAADLSKKIQQSRSELSQRFKEFYSVSALEKGQLAPQLEVDLVDMQAAIATLSAIQKNVELSAEKSFVLTKQAELRKAKSDMKVMIKHDENTGVLAREIAAILTDNDIKIVTGASRNGNSVLKIESKVQNMRIQSAYVARIELKLDAVDENGKTIKSYIKTLNGASPSNYSMALEQANLALLNAIKEDEVMRSFGF